MILFLIFLFLYLLLLFFPFLLSKGIKYEDGMEKSLIVKRDNRKDGRYFSKSFRQFMKNAEEEGEFNETTLKMIQLSKEEGVLFWNGEETLGDELNCICYIEKETVFDKKMILKKEVYAKRNVTFFAHTCIRAVAGDENVIIGEKSKVVRWADAEKLLLIKKGSDGGKSISSGERLVISEDCVFTRLYAPVIEVGKKEVADVTMEGDLPVYKKIERNLKQVGEHQEIRNTIITKYNLCIERGAIVYGDMKSDKKVHIKKNGIITGNVFAEDDVILEGCVKVLGNVFAGKNLYIGPDVTIGRAGETKSALSRMDLVIAEGAVIYGYAGCENKGKTVTKEEFLEKLRKKEKGV